MVNVIILVIFTNIAKHGDPVGLTNMTTGSTPPGWLAQKTTFLTIGKQNKEIPA